MVDLRTPLDIDVSHVDELSVTATWRVVGHEPFFDGMLPGRPMVAGLMMLDVAAVMAGMLPGVDDRHVPYISRVDLCRVGRSIIPPTVIDLSLTVTDRTATGVRFKSSVSTPDGGSGKAIGEVTWVPVDSIPYPDTEPRDPIVSRYPNPELFLPFASPFIFITAITDVDPDTFNAAGYWDVPTSSPLFWTVDGRVIVPPSVLLESAGHLMMGNTMACLPLCENRWAVMSAARHCRVIRPVVGGERLHLTAAAPEVVSTGDIPTIRLNDGHIAVNNEPVADIEFFGAVIAPEDGQGTVTYADHGLPMMTPQPELPDRA